VLGGDTGLLHLAAAMGKRVLMLFAPYGPGSTSPYGHSDWIVAAPPKGPVADIAVEEVNATLEQALVSVTVHATA
jgi:ADP-heptose:LPS heptosyltransferase